MYPNKYISELIQDAVNKEYANRDFYNNLSDLSTDIDDKKILKDISMDEEKHAKILKELYYIINSSYPDLSKAEIYIDNDLTENICSAIMDETKAVEGYRAILFALESQNVKDMIMEIIFDEQNHAAKLNYLYSKNK